MPDMHDRLLRFILVAVAPLSACMPAGPVVRQVDDGVISIVEFDAGGGPMVDVGVGPGLIVSGAADAAAAQAAIAAFCADVAPTAAAVARAPVRLNPDSGHFEMPGTC